VTAEARVCTTGDGLALEAEYAGASVTPPHAGVVLCHPHPQYGGTMRSIVISALFEALPRLGVACLRFNFRGVEGSAGTHGDGADEPLDVLAALDVLSAELHPAVPVTLVGWSFGADMALSVGDPRLAGWVAIAPPLRYPRATQTVGDDPRPKLVILAEHDEFRSPAEVEEATARWVHTERILVAGASHFFVGRTERVVDATAEFVLASDA
jgi:alpha/beta superfamily hydrolase